VKLVIQIPCYNEEESLPATLGSLPTAIPGVDQVEIVVVDDGSTDDTTGVARRFGVRHIVRSPVNQGLARAFSAGLDYALRLGADVIVNTDADGQYPGAAIPALIGPILHHDADIVIGNRRPHQLAHFSYSKRALQWFGSWIVRGLSGTNVPDVTSGFRAFSREAALRMNVVSEFTYTLETIIQAGKKQLFVTHIDVDARETKRPSRLFRGAGSYVFHSVATIGRIYALYNPMRVFSLLGGSLLLGGTAIGLRFLYYYLTTGGTGRIQSLILAAVLLIVGFQTILFGLIADLIGSSRTMLEDALLRIRRLELERPE
jgi:glycosyltransferase involved in cell wall biosynthesis